MPKLRWTTRVINESMRLYPQPPVLIRRAAVDTKLVRRWFVLVSAFFPPAIECFCAPLCFVDFCLARVFFGEENKRREQKNSLLFFLLSLPEKKKKTHEKNREAIRSLPAPTSS